MCFFKKKKGLFPVRFFELSRRSLFESSRVPRAREGPTYVPRPTQRPLTTQNNQPTTPTTALPSAGFVKADHDDDDDDDATGDAGAAPMKVSHD